MKKKQVRRTRNVSDKRARIISAAQILFTCKGYSQASVRDIAAAAEVAVGLVIRHFESKLKLFELALIDALSGSPVDASSRAGFGASVATVVLSKETKVVLPSMVILSIEDEDARRVAMQGVRK